MASKGFIYVRISDGLRPSSSILTTARPAVWYLLSCQLIQLDEMKILATSPGTLIAAAMVLAAYILTTATQGQGRHYIRDVSSSAVMSPWFHFRYPQRQKPSQCLAIKTSRCNSTTIAKIAGISILAMAIIEPGMFLSQPPIAYQRHSMLWATHRKPQ